MRTRLFACLALILLTSPLAGCVTPMTEATAEQIEGKSIAIATAPSSGLQAQTGTKAALLGTIFGPMAAYAVGNDIIKSNNVPDPAITIAKNLAPRLAKKYHLKVRNKEPITDLRENYQGVAADQKADLLLIVQTGLMNSMYFLTTINHYHVTIGIDAHLYDAKTGHDLALVSCWYKPEYEHSSDAPSYEDLYDNGAAGFKKELKAAEEQCVQDFMKKL